MSLKSRRDRLLGRALQMPARLDRRGSRRLLQVLSPATVIVLVHRGRKSGRIYKTPLEIITDDDRLGGLVIAPMWGKGSDWYRNVVAGGLMEVRVGAESWKAEWRALDQPESAAALDAYRRAHPMYSRIILGVLVRLNKLDGEHVLPQELPMLALRPVG